MHFELKKSRLQITPRNDVTNSSNHPILLSFNWLTEIAKEKKELWCRILLFSFPSHFSLVMFSYFILFFSLGFRLLGKLFAFSYVDVNALYYNLSYTLSSNNGRSLLFLNKSGIIIVITVDEVKIASLIPCFSVGWSVQSLSTKFKLAAMICFSVIPL